MRLTSSSAGAGTAGEWQSSRRTLWEHGIHSATATTTGRSRLCLARTPGLHCLSTLPPHARPFGARLLGASDAPARYSLLARGAGVGGLICRVLGRAAHRRQTAGQRQPRAGPSALRYAIIRQPSRRWLRAYIRPHACLPDGLPPHAGM